MKYLKTYNEKDSNAQFCVITHNLEQLQELKINLEKVGCNLNIPPTMHQFFDKFGELYVYIFNKNSAGKSEAYAWIHHTKKWPDVIHIDFDDSDVEGMLSIIQGNKLGLI